MVTSKWIKPSQAEVGKPLIVLDTRLITASKVGDGEHAVRVDPRLFIGIIVIDHGEYEPKRLAVFNNLASHVPVSKGNWIDITYLVQTFEFPRYRIDHNTIVIL